MTGATAAMAIETGTEYAERLRVEREQHAARARAQAKLTDDEVEIIKWISLGKTNPDIATIMGVPGDWAVAKRVTRILEKIGVPTRPAAVRWALRNGVIE